MDSKVLEKIRRIDPVVAAAVRQRARRAPTASEATAWLDGYLSRMALEYPQTVNRIRDVLRDAEAEKLPKSGV